MSLPLDTIPLVLIFCLLLMLLSFFAGTEFPLLSISEHKIQAFLKQKRFWSQSLAHLRKKGEALLVTNLIGTTLATVGASSIATFLAIHLAETSLYPHERVIIIIEILSSLAILFLGEIAPKIIGITIPDSIALLVAPLYRWIFFIFRPISFLVEGFMHLISLIVWRPLEMHARKISGEELDAFIDMSHEGGAVEADERRQIKNLLTLPDTTAESVMTPRVHVEFVDLDMTVDQACEILMNSSHSRIPICGDSTDDIDYVITFREAFKLQREQHGHAYLRDLNLEKIMKVPLTQPLDDLFEKFQKSRRHIALVVDEHGGTAWVVTMEDVLEEVFGDIKDEKDKEEIYLKRSKNGTIEAVGTVLMDDIIEEYDISPEEYGIPPAYLGEPLAYVVMAETEVFPQVGAQISFTGTLGKIVIRVVSVEDNVIGRLECIKE